MNSSHFDELGTTSHPQREGATDTTFTIGLPQWPIARLAERNPLLRMTDRLEAVAWVLTVAVALLAIPIVAAIGTAMYDVNRHAYAEQALTRQTVTATVTDDEGPQDSRTADTKSVPARWVVAGTEHTGAVKAPATAKSGDPVEIWVDTDGSLAAAPGTSSRAAVEAVTVAVVLWIGVAAVAAVTFSTARAALDRKRDAGWQRAIDSLVDHDDGRPRGLPT